MIEIEAGIVVGVRGVALVDLQAKLQDGLESLEDGYSPSDAVLDDLDNWGIDDWFPYVMNNKQPEEGAYKLKAVARWAGSYDDAEIEYNDVKLEPVESDINMLRKRLNDAEREVDCLSV